MRGTPPINLNKCKPLIGVSLIYAVSTVVLIMTKFDNDFILSTDELKELLEKAFSNGALSHAKWDGQRDTCWSNVNEDMKEEVSAILLDLNSKVVTNNCA
jgi:hypothetical protein